MNLKLRNSLIFVCFCMFGIQTGLSMLGEMRDIMNNCPREGGYCINTIPPQPKRRMRNNRRRNRARMGTRTRKGQRQKPSPRALGAQNNVLPGGAKARAPAAAAAAPGQAAPMAPQQQFNQIPQQQQQQQQQTYNPFADFFNFGMGGTGTGTGASTGSSMDPFFGMMMFSRKKRQAAAPPQFEPGEAPVRLPGQSLYGFLNQNCLKSEFDFGCRNTGGFCCVPHP